MLAEFVQGEDWDVTSVLCDDRSHGIKVATVKSAGLPRFLVGMSQACRVHLSL